MDLKALRDQAIMEANDEFYQLKVYQYKHNVKNCIRKISENNAQIELLQANNASLKKQLSEYDLEEFKRVQL